MSDNRVFVFVAWDGQVVIEAHHELGGKIVDLHEQSNDASRVLHWAKQRAEDILLRIDGDDFFYWCGQSEPPTDADVRLLPFDPLVLGHLNLVAHEIRRCKEVMSELEARIERLSGGGGEPRRETEVDHVARTERSSESEASEGPPPSGGDS